MTTAVVCYSFFQTSDHVVVYYPRMGSFFSKAAERVSDQASSSEYRLHKHGRPRTADFRVFFEKDGIPISPFHDIPLYADEEKQVLNMVVEIPRWTNAKYEVGNAVFGKSFHERCLTLK